MKYDTCKSNLYSWPDFREVGVTMFSFQHVYSCKHEWCEPVPARVVCVRVLVVARVCCCNTCHYALFTARSCCGT